MGERSRVEITDKAAYSTAFDPVGSILLSMTVGTSRVRAVGRRTSPPERITFFYFATTPILGSDLSVLLFPPGISEPLRILQTRGQIVPAHLAVDMLPFVDEEGMERAVGTVIDSPEDFENYSMECTGVFLTEEDLIRRVSKDDTESVVVVPKTPKRKRKLLLRKK
jgi:hypothetical protein